MAHTRPIILSADLLRADFVLFRGWHWELMDAHTKPRSSMAEKRLACWLADLIKSSPPHTFRWRDRLLFPAALLFLSFRAEHHPSNIGSGGETVLLPAFHLAFSWLRRGSVRVRILPRVLPQSMGGRCSRCLGRSQVHMLMVLRRW